MNYKAFIRCCAIGLLCLCLPLTACGKKGAPMPQDNKRLFVWKSAEATLSAAQCLTVVGEMSGATQNISEFILELEPETDAICKECPFSPSETASLTPQEALNKANGMRYLFTYCPSTPAPSYRWRLVAKNMFAAIPFALSPVKTVK